MKQLVQDLQLQLVLRPSWLQSVRQLCECPLVVHHIEVTDVVAHFRVILAGHRRIWAEWLTPTVSHYLDCIGYHPHFLKIDQIVNKRFVALMSECHVFDQQRHEGNDGRLQLGHGQSVRTVVSGRVHEVFKFRIKLLKLAGKLLPGLTQPAYRWITQAHDDREKGI